MRMPPLLEKFDKPGAQLTAFHIWKTPQKNRIPFPGAVYVKSHMLRQPACCQPDYGRKREGHGLGENEKADMGKENLPVRLSNPLRNVFMLP